MQNLKFILEYLSLESIAFYLKDNLHKVIGIFILAIGAVFTVLYYLNQNYDKNQQITGSYVISTNYFAEKDYVLSLRHAQNSYNNSKKLLEVASLMQVVDVLMLDEQYDKVFEIINDAVNLKQNSDEAFVLYSYIFKTLQTLHNKLPEKYSAIEVMKSVQEKLEHCNVSKGYLMHKNALLTEINAMTNLHKPGYYIAKIDSQNELGKILNTIAKK